MIQTRVWLQGAGGGGGAEDSLAPDLGAFPLGSRGQTFWWSFCSHPRGGPPLRATLVVCTVGVWTVRGCPVGGLDCGGLD
ncbi:unnamed protein product [Gadus morhua 'NCC']